jgi:uncharacterized membrane protein YciS (DUF1049 family)
MKEDIKFSILVFAIGLSVAFAIFGWMFMEIAKDLKNVVDEQKQTINQLQFEANKNKSLSEEFYDMYERCTGGYDNGNN